MWKRVDSYVLNWHHAKRTGAIHLKLEDGEEGILPHLSCQDLSALGAILRDEPLAWYHTVRCDLTTHASPEDEEDRD